MKQIAWCSALLLLVALVGVTTQGPSLAQAPAGPGPADQHPVGLTGRQGAPDPAGDRRPSPMEALQAIPQAETPLMFQVAGGPPGEPTARRCEGCRQDLLLAAPDDATASLPSSAGPASGWQAVEREGFEVAWPWPGGCWRRVDGSADGLDRTWDSAEGRSHEGERALWPAAGGEDAWEPGSPAGYPGDLDSWLLCGPLDLSQASSASVAFWLWSQIEEGHDEVFVGVSDGSDDWFQGYAWDVSVASWAPYTLYFPGYTGSPAYDAVWLAWNFQSDATNPVPYEGPWIDDVEIARALPCPVVDPGPKGLQVHPRELPGQTARIADAGTGWVRLEFQMESDGSLDLDRYAGIVAGLCGEGVAVLGLVDYVSLPDDLDGDGHEDYDDPADYLPYQERFAETVELLAHHFRGSIRHWEIWNEENGQTWHVDPAYYARLLVKVSEILKQVDADNQVLFGGLDHVWAPSQYLEPVYHALDLTWGGARPFDILAVHPYFTQDEDEFFLDPNVYLWDDGHPPQTVLDPYLDLMAARGDGDVDLWITEIGWNSALGNPAIDNCPGMESWCVDRAVQADYMGDSFDILFDQVEDPEGNRDRVKTVVWYQYLDTASTWAELAEKVSLQGAELGVDPDAICPADWGLVDGNREPKLSYWAYQIYPQRARGWTLVSFSATPQQGASRSVWRTADEDNLLGFYLDRAASPDGPRTRLNEVLIPSQPPEQPEGGEYEFLDRDVIGGTTYFYFLVGVLSDSSAITYGPVRATVPDEAIAGLEATNDSPTPVGETTTLTATVSSGTSVTYTWALGEGSEGSGPVVVHTYPWPGFFQAVVTASNSVGELTATTTVTISGLTATNDSPTALGETTTLTATAPASGYLTYTWALGDGGGGSQAVVTHTYPYAGLYTALVTASNGLRELTATTAVTVDEVITGLMASNDSPTVLGQATLLTATVTAGSNLTYTWALGDGRFGAGEVTTHTYTETGLYTAVVTAHNSVSQRTAATTVDIRPRPKAYRYLPLLLREALGLRQGAAPLADRGRER